MTNWVTNRIQQQQKKTHPSYGDIRKARREDLNNRAEAIRIVTKGQPTGAASQQSQQLNLSGGKQQTANLRTRAGQANRTALTSDEVLKRKQTFLVGDEEVSQPDQDSKSQYGSGGYQAP